MGSVVQVVVGDAPPGVVDWAFDEIESLEQSWSRFRDTSDLSILNASPRPRHRGQPSPLECAHTL